MRVAMCQTWSGIAQGSKGTVQKAKGTDNGTELTVKFDYGETRTVPLVATLSEMIYNKQFK